MPGQHCWPERLSRHLSKLINARTHWHKHAVTALQHRLMYIKPMTDETVLVNWNRTLSLTEGPATLCRLQLTVCLLRGYMQTWRLIQVMMKTLLLLWCSLQQCQKLKSAIKGREKDLYGPKVGSVTGSNMGVRVKCLSFILFVSSLHQVLLSLSARCTLPLLTICKKTGSDGHDFKHEGYVVKYYIMCWNFHKRSWIHHYSDKYYIWKWLWWLQSIIPKCFFWYWLSRVVPDKGP